jgi:4-hydroxybenzoate polyprenyltransferase
MPVTAQISKSETLPHPQQSRLQFADVVRLLRPRQWPKNIIAFAPALFASVMFTDKTFLHVTLCVVALSFCSSGIYLINDVVDCEQDRLHPVKSKRPIASGAVNIKLAICLSVFLIIAGFALAFLLPAPLAGGLIAGLSAYVALMLAYCLWLKNVILLDIFSIAAGFVIRVWTGAAVAAVPISGWLLLCTTFGALFLSVEKRMQELNLLEKAAGHHRKTMNGYSRELLDRLEGLILPSVIISYSLYAFHSPHGQSMLITVPFVLYGFMRYLYLSVHTRLTGSPEEVLLTDRPIQIAMVLWVLAAAAVIYHIVPQLPLINNNPVPVVIE